MRTQVKNTLSKDLQIELKYNLTQIEQGFSSKFEQLRQDIIIIDQDLADKLKQLNQTLQSEMDITDKSLQALQQDIKKCYDLTTIGGTNQNKGEEQGKTDGSASSGLLAQMQQ